MRPREARLDARDLLLDQRRRAVLQVRPLGFDFLAELVRAALLHQDLDARLVDVVAPAVAVVDAQDRVEVGEQVPPGQELADHVADDRRAAQAAADQHLEADFASSHPARRAGRYRARATAARSAARAVHRDLELARQVGELRMEGRPLADQLAPDEGVDDLVLRRRRRNGRW